MMAPSRILVVIPTFNRRELIQLTSSYLRTIDFNPGRFSFVVSDDCSTDYGLPFLKNAYSHLPGVRFMRTSRNSGPIVHTCKLLRFFADSAFDKILLLDSDLILHERYIQWVDDFDGELISSLYNSCFHRVEKHCGSYCTKVDIGWAGALIERSVVEELLGVFGAQPFDDWALSDLAKRRNLTIKVATPSAIEHIGIVGFNNATPEYFDHAFDFPAEYIDHRTRDFFAQRYGIDLVGCLRAPPDQSHDPAYSALGRIRLER